MQRLTHSSCRKCCVQRLTPAKSLHSSSKRAAQTAEQNADAFDLVSTAELDLASSKSSTRPATKSTSGNDGQASQPGTSSAGQDRPYRPPQARLSEELMRQRRIALGQRVPHRRSDSSGLNKASVSRPDGTPQPRSERPRFKRVDFEGASAAFARPGRPDQAADTQRSPLRRPRNDDIRKEADEAVSLIISIGQRKQQTNFPRRPMPRQETPGSYPSRQGNDTPRADQPRFQDRRGPNQMLRSSAGSQRGDRGPRTGGPARGPPRRPLRPRSAQASQGRRRGAETSEAKRITLSAPPTDARSLIDTQITIRSIATPGSASLSEHATQAGDWRAMFTAAQEARAASSKNSPSRMLDSGIRNSLLRRAELAAAYNAKMPIASKVQLATTLERVVPA